MRRSDLRPARVLARAELRARARQLRGNRRRLAATALLALQFVVVLPAMAAPLLHSLGRDLGSGDPRIGLVGAAVGLAAAGGLYVGGAGTVVENRVGAVDPLARTSMSPAAVVLGRQGAELGVFAAMVVPPALVALGLVGVGAGSPVPPVVLALALLPVALVGTFAGRTAGAALTVHPAVARLSTWAKVVGALAVMAVAFVGTQLLVRGTIEEGSGGLGALVPVLLPGRPLQAYAAVVLAPLGGGPDALGLAVAGGVVLALPASAVLAVRVEAATLGRDAVAEASGSTAGSRAVPPVFDRRPEGRVAWRYLCRTARDPRMLSHLAPLLFGLMGAAPSLASEPTRLVHLGPDAALAFGAVLAGATFCLNPLGDERDQLPLVLTSAPSTAVVLRGRAVAGVAVGLALALGVGVPLGLLAGAPALVVGRAALAVLFCTGAAFGALGLGALVPRFERREYMNVERAHPSMVAVLGFGFGTTVLVAVAAVLLRVTVDGGPSPTALAVGWAVVAALVLGGGVAGYRYAVCTFDALVLDDV